MVTEIRGLCAGRASVWESASLPSDPVLRDLHARMLCEGCPILQACAIRAIKMRPRPVSMVWAGVAFPDLNATGGAARAWAMLHEVAVLPLPKGTSAPRPVLPPGGQAEQCKGTCGRMVRPSRALEDEWPGTVCSTRKGWCKSCARADVAARRLASV